MRYQKWLIPVAVAAGLLAGPIADPLVRPLVAPMCERLAVGDLLREQLKP